MSCTPTPLSQRPEDISLSDAKRTNARSILIQPVFAITRTRIRTQTSSCCSRVVSIVEYVGLVYCTISVAQTYHTQNPFPSTFDAAELQVFVLLPLHTFRQVNRRFHTREEGFLATRNNRLSNTHIDAQRSIFHSERCVLLALTLAKFVSRQLGKRRAGKRTRGEQPKS